MRIIVIEDEPKIAQALRAGLEAERYEVAVAATGEQGFFLLSSELFDQAVEIILETGRGSVSLLQRRLTIGYGRASRLIDQMYEAGLVGEYKGSQAREILITQEEWEALKRQRDREEAAEQDSPEGA